jgi:mono/diheme cytochrome c family protein
MNQFSKKWTLLCILIFPAVLLAAEKGDSAKGKELFGSRCAVCHGVAGNGNKAIGDALGVKMPILSSKEAQSINNADLKKIVLEGKGKMKPVALSDQDLENAIAFLRSLKK